VSKFLQKWKAAEPVRLYLYGVLVPVVAGLVAFGVLDQELVPYVIATATAALGIAGIESARASVVAPLSLALPDGQQVAHRAVDSVPASVLHEALVREFAARHRAPQVDQ